MDFLIIQFSKFWSQDSISNFAISKNGDYKKLYPKSIVSFNNYEKYEFIFEKEENINQFEILKNFFPGSKISIKNVRVFNDKNNKLNLENLVIHSLGSYIVNQTNDEVVFFAGNLKNDILKFNLSKEFLKINKITLDLKLERLSLSNNAICNNLDEN